VTEWIRGESRSSNCQNEIKMKNHRLRLALSLTILAGDSKRLVCLLGLIEGYRRDVILVSLSWFTISPISVWPQIFSREKAQCSAIGWPIIEKAKG
jgi:hypothetical protein